MKIVSAASEFPPNVYSQGQFTAVLINHWGARLDRPEFLDRLHARTGVETRNLAFTFDRYASFSSWGETNRAWFDVGASLGAHAIEKALHRAGLRSDNLDALYVVSITGIASPSLDARLINRMGLPTDIKRTPIFGLGCVGGAVGLTRAADYVKAYPDDLAVLLSVELCSLSLVKDDLSTANLIATGLFGDGAVAVVVGGETRRGDGPTIFAQRSVFYPNTEDIMGWDISERGFAVVLSPRLPDLIRQRLGKDVDAFLASNGLSREDIGSWAIHPGGPKVLEAVEWALGLDHDELRLSWETLARRGNLSSGSVLYLLEEMIQAHRPQQGTIGLILAMGPGFCSEMLLVRW
jgi:alkylresorcinol/alkylpyrone synthase